MPNQSELILILHIVTISFFLGGQFFYLFIIQPTSHQFFSINDQVRYMQNVLRRQNPVLLFTLCLAVITGGFMITPLKSSLGQSYFTVFGAQLMRKLGYFLLVFFITAYQTLGVGFKIRYLDPAKEMLHLKERLGNVRTNMTVTAVLNILLTSYVIYLARHLS